MPTPPNNPSVARVALRVQRDTRDFINTFHVRRGDAAALSAADLVAIGGVFADWWLNSYRLAVPNNIVGQDITVTKLDPSDPLQNTTFIAAPGTGGATAYPADVTAAVSWRTGLAGRKYRGRFYDFSIVQGNANQNDTMVGTLISALTAVGQYLLNHYTSAALKGVVFHRPTDTYTDISTVIVDQLVDSMRNRLAGRGI